MIEFSIKTNEGEYDLEAHVRLIGRDILVAIWGGERPHIGAVSMAAPRPSCKCANITSSTASVYCFLGHKEGTLAKTVAEVLAASTDRNTVVTAGIHWDNIDENGIDRVMRNSEILVDIILNKITFLSYEGNEDRKTYTRCPPGIK